MLHIKQVSVVLVATAHMAFTGWMVDAAAQRGSFLLTAAALLWVPVSIAVWFASLDVAQRMER